MLGLGIGGFLIAVGFVSQWLLKKRLRNEKLKKFYMWVAWSFALLGGAVAAPASGGNTIGITSAGAGAVSLAMLLVLGVDLADKRPDWPAFIIVVAVPWFMRWTGGQLGAVFDAILTPLQLVGHTVLGVIGG
jgi:hypothetical protein